MNFESTLESTGSAENDKEFERILQEHMVPGEISEKSLWRAMSQIFPGVKAVDIMVVDSDERQHRQNLSRQMRGKMRNYLLDNYKTTKERASWRENQPDMTQNRALTDDTLLKLPHPEQTEEYKRRYNILAAGTPEQKRNLLFEELRKLKKKYTRESLTQMTDTQIVEDFEDLERLQGFVASVQKLSGDPSLQLNEDQRQELLDFQAEFSAAPLVYTRAELIANPLYSLIRAENLPGFNPFQIDTDKLVDSDKKAKALDSLLSDASAVRSYAEPFLESEIMRRMGTQYRPEQISWLNADDQPLEAVYNYTTKKYTPPLNGLLDGKRLTGVLPDGTKKSVYVKRLPNGSIELADGVPERKKNRFAGMSIPDIANTLYEQMNACDPWYVLSSDEFSSAKVILSLLPSKFNGTTAEDQAQLRLGLSRLKTLSERYLTAKENKTSYSKREQERRAAMEAIAEFAELTDMQLRDELGLHGMYEGHTDFAEDLADSTEPTAEKQDSLLGEDAIDEPNDISFAESSEPEQLYDEKIEQYANMDCKPLDKNNHALQDLQKDAVEAARAMATGGQSAMLGRGSEPFWKLRMAQLTLFHMVMIERSSSKSTGKPGLIENALNGHKDAMVQDICSNPDFVSEIGTLTPERISRFLLNDEARSICKNIIAKSVNAAKHHANPEPKMHAQKTMENPMPKM